jgi:hypothetical protein
LSEHTGADSDAQQLTFSNIDCNSGVVIPPIVVPRTSPPPPPCNTRNLEELNVIRIAGAESAVPSGNIYCRMINEDGVFVQNTWEIGSQTVIDRGVLQAADIAAMYGDGRSETVFSNIVTVCLQGNGDLIFLDATEAPRVPRTLTSRSIGSYTCGNLAHAGTLVLVNPSR